ncbi:class I SAM-dependent RNA methyltransferase [uncultured Corynebacterium sp.]|uniref:class I SAM-dependent RNA methyltransferase n=1 Tax=uncultured Corynebacterium sp. TaxID=159447 RepID=UPI0025CFDDD3|nr:RsmD family RNA methyltransferase [uncultured Corynebacterium sp.]
MGVNKNEEVVIDLAGPANGGTVIGRLDGQIVFVRGGLPGEKDVTVALDPARNSKAKKGFRNGEVVAIGQPNVHRVAPVCPAAQAGAGCCDLDFVDAAGSLDYKKQVVLDQLARVGKIDAETLQKITADALDTESLEPFVGSRTRVRLAVDGEGNVGQRARGSHQVVPVDKPCAQWSKSLQEGLAEDIEQLRAAGKLIPNTEIAVAVADDGTRKMVQLQGKPSALRVEAFDSNCADSTGNAGELPIVSRTVHFGAGLDREFDVQWESQVQDFWQAHRAAPEFYSSWIARHIPPTTQGEKPHGANPKQSVAWDLYGGAGVFSAALSRKVDRVVCVDVAGSASEAGAKALGAAGIDNVEFVGGDVAGQVPQLPRGGSLHAVVLDPPRTGAGTQAVVDIAKARPRHVVHVGCDPATAARDLSAWIANGYAIKNLCVVDAFGLNHHVELLAYLVPDRRGRTRP